jgi:hypothetical protein
MKKKRARVKVIEKVEEGMLGAQANLSVNLETLMDWRETLSKVLIANRNGSPPVKDPPRLVLNMDHRRLRPRDNHLNLVASKHGSTR